MLCRWLLNSAPPWLIQPWMFDVQEISASPSQWPMVSPYHCGTSGPRRGTSSDTLKLRADVDLRHQRLGGIAHVQHQVRGDDEVDPVAAVLGEATHESIGPAILAGPLRRVVARRCGTSAARNASGIQTSAARDTSGSAATRRSTRWQSWSCRGRTGRSSRAASAAPGCRSAPRARASSSSAL